MIIINKLLKFIKQVILYEKEQIKLVQKIFLIKNNFLSFKQKLIKQIYIYFIYYTINLNYFVVLIYEATFYNEKTKKTTLKTSFKITDKNYLDIFFKYYKSFFIKKKFNFTKQFLIILKNYMITMFTFISFNVKWILLASIISFIYFFFSLFYIQIDFSKQIALWYLLLITYYLLMSTFNSFLNKYKYGKFTSAIQRFWKRTGMIFWILEGFLFLLFFYYFLNSSQEPLYMYDYSNLNQEFLIQLKNSYKNMILLSLAIYLSFFLILNINFLIYYQSIIILLCISLIIFYTLYIESYQFVYIINIFADTEWIFEEKSQTWTLEIEENNLRVKQQYFILCLVAKYWHFIFIFISWFFFLIKSLEINKINITLLGYNVQNLLILYILNLMCLIQWFKYVFKKFLEITYYWFHIQYDEKLSITFILECWTTIINFFSIPQMIHQINNIIYISSTIYSTNELSLWKYI